MRLAEHVEGTVHYQQLLETMTPDEFDEWIAKDRIEPIGHATRCLGVIARALVVQLGAEDEAAKAVYTPWMDFEERERETTGGNAAGKALLTSVFGKPKRHGHSGRSGSKPDSTD